MFGKFYPFKKNNSKKQALELINLLVVKEEFIGRWVKTPDHPNTKINTIMALYLPFFWHVLRTEVSDV